MTTLLITIITAVACALIGNMLVLKKLSLMGDAISHAVLPGIVLAFFIVGGLDSPLFFIVAVALAVAMSVCIQWITDRVAVSEESVIGIFFTFLFSVGVVLLVRYADNVHLDQDAVLYGQVEFASLNRLIVSGQDVGPRALWTMGSVLLLNLSALLLFFKEFKITTFDPLLAGSLGISPRKTHYFIMILTAVTVVAAFEAVGAILVVALLVVPPAAAYVVSGSFWGMLALSTVFAIMASISGYYFAVGVDASIAGAVAAACGVILGAVVLGKKLRGMQ